jgi:hypothetical protein
MHSMMGQQEASEPIYAPHVTGLVLHEPSTISTAPLSLTGVLPVGLSVHDTLPTNHIDHGILQALTNLDIDVSDSKTGVLPVGLSVHDILPTNHSDHGILQALTNLDIDASDSKTGVLPVGSSVHDTLPTNHHNHGGIAQAFTGLDIDVSDPKHLLTGNQAELIKADMAQAAKEWLDHIDGPYHAPINILLNITDDDKTHSRLDGGPAFFVSTGTGANATYESAVEYKLQTGADPTTGLESFPKLSDGAQAEVVINVNSHYLNSFAWLDPTPADGSDLPANKLDMVSELMHEFGHGLGIGITNTLDTKTGTFGAGEKSTWESLLDIEESGTYFTGPHAVKEHGGPVVVTTNTPEENYSHLGNTLSDATDPHTGGPDVMYGVSFDWGRRYEVSDLDVAILQDLGYHTKGPEVHIVEVGHPSWLDIHSLVSTLPETIANHAENYATNLSTLLGEGSGLSHGFWDQAATASGISSLLGSDAIQGLDTWTAVHQSSLVVTQIADQLSHLSSGAHSEISALTATHVVAPPALAHDHIVHLQHDIPYLSEFAHQMHI